MCDGQKHTDMQRLCCFTNTLPQKHRAAVFSEGQTLHLPCSSFLAVSAQLSASQTACVCVGVCVVGGGASVGFSHLYSSVWSCTHHFVCPFWYRWLVALTLSPHVITMHLGSWHSDVRGIYVSSARRVAWDAIHDSSCTIRISLIDLQDIFLSFFYTFLYQLHTLGEHQWQAVIVYINTRCCRRTLLGASNVWVCAYTRA